MPLENQPNRPRGAGVTGGGMAGVHTCPTGRLGRSVGAAGDDNEVGGNGEMAKLTIRGGLTMDRTVMPTA